MSTQRFRRRRHSHERIGNPNPISFESRWAASGVYLVTVTVNDDDFLSVSPAGVDGPRQPDGSLPELDYLRLVPGSDLIDAGVDVGLPYDGSAPDMGAFEG